MQFPDAGLPAQDKKSGRGQPRPRMSKKVSEKILIKLVCIKYLSYLHQINKFGELTKTTIMSNAEKLKALKLTMDKIDKDFGKGSVMLMNEKSQDPMEVISTGSIGLDVALGVGGLPKGRIVEIYGPESSGKTTVATHIIAEAQKK